MPRALLDCKASIIAVDVHIAACAVWHVLRWTDISCFGDINSCESAISCVLINFAAVKAILLRIVNSAWLKLLTNLMLNCESTVIARDVGVTTRTLNMVAFFVASRIVSLRADGSLEHFEFNLN